MKKDAGELSSKVSRPSPADRSAAQSADSCYKVLFVCKDNSACSIIAESILKRWGGKQFRAFSAGIHPASEVNPQAIAVLKAQRLWGQGIQTKGCIEYLKDDAQSMNFIICIGDQPPVDLPVKWPGNPTIIHWRISNPIVDGKLKEKALAFRKTFLELENRIKLFILIYERERAEKAAA
ncbi:MAG: arsenate reductase ArsC [Candidatus Binatus sp.]|jgi:protein-tyrosine-phosphatase